MPAVAARVALVLLDRRALQWLWWLLAAGLGVVVLVFASLGGLAGDQTSGGSSPSATALADIPPAFLAAYQAAGAKYGVDWAVLAGIGKMECDHGRGAEAACRVVGAQNSAGAGGPMQFLASTWAQYGVDAAGRRVGDDRRWDPEAAVYSAANYLRASGAPGDYRQAIFAYNHATWYIADVLAWAAKYRAAAVQAIPAGQTVPGDAARITAQGFALAPADVPAPVQQMVAAGNLIVRFPYVYGGGHGSPAALDLRHPQPDGGGYDCSSSVSYLLHAAGLLDHAEASGALMSYGQPGPGRWVTIFANSGHTFMAVAGIVMNTAWYAPLQPTSPSSGPRWQPGSTAAAQARGSSYGGFAVRHPPGL